MAAGRGVSSSSTPSMTSMVASDAANPPPSLNPPRVVIEGVLLKREKARVTQGSRWSKKYVRFLESGAGLVKKAFRLFVGQELAAEADLPLAGWRGRRGWRGGFVVVDSGGRGRCGSVWRRCGCRQQPALLQQPAAPVLPLTPGFWQELPAVNHPYTPTASPRNSYLKS